ncbi:MAG: MBL fold metallo-hydrolase [Gemmatimonadetes bacterium]|nr:MBL fold metallo-hydrolase [Gemmatimonadota bacterium]
MPGNDPTAVGDLTLIDLRHQGNGGAIACYLLDAEGPTIVDPGPSTTVDRLVDELAARGVGRDDLRHVLLTHVHLDHAGATGHLLRRFPQAKVWLHADAAPHLIDPTRLVASTRRTFGAMHDELWGEVLPAAGSRVEAVGLGWRLGRLRAIHTPGHISHHLAYLDEGEGTLYSGDSMGIVLGGGPTHPPTPPPAVDLRAWENTLAALAAFGIERFAATHFGTHSDFEKRRTDLADRLCKLEAEVRQAMARNDDGAGARYHERALAEQSVGRDDSDRKAMKRYFDTFPARTDWAGVVFYLERNP